MEAFSKFQKFVAGVSLFFGGSEQKEQEEQTASSALATEQSGVLVSTADDARTENTTDSERPSSLKKRLRELGVSQEASSGCFERRDLESLLNQHEGTKVCPGEEQTLGVASAQEESDAEGCRKRRRLGVSGQTPDAMDIEAVQTETSTAEACQADSPAEEEYFTPRSCDSDGEFGDQQMETKTEHQSMTDVGTEVLGRELGAADSLRAGPQKEGCSTPETGRQVTTDQLVKQKSKFGACVAQVWQEMVQEEMEAEKRAAESAAKAEDEAKAAVREAENDKEVNSDDDLDTDFGMGALKLEQRKHLDLHLLADLIKASWPVLEHIKGKDVVLLLGNTGVGKSLLIQAVSGREIRRKRLQSRPLDAGSDAGSANQQLSTVVPELLHTQGGSSSVSQGEAGTGRLVWEAVNPVPGFEVGHDQASKTKSFRHWTSASSVVYLDAPGFEDTDGPEVDIATAVVFREVAKVCNRLRFAVLIGCTSLDHARGGAVRKVADMVFKVVKDFEKHKTAFTFLFTKTEALGPAQTALEAKELLRDRLQEICDAPNKDEKAQPVLKRILGCMNQDKPYVGIYHPDLSDVPTLRSMVESFERLDTGGSPRSAAISSPSTVVCMSMPFEAESKLRLDVGALSEELNVALESLRCTQAERLFGTLRLLRERIDDPFLSAAHDAAIKCWGEHGTAWLHRTYEQIESGKVGLGPDGYPSANCFSVDHGQEILRGIARLQVLNRLEVTVPGVSPDAAKEAFSQLEQYQSCILGNVHNGFSPKHGSTHAEFKDAHQSRALAFSALGMLRTWAKVHSEFSHEAEQAEAALRQSQEQALAAAAELATSAGESDVSALAFAFMQLSQLQEMAPARDDCAEMLSQCKQRFQEAIGTVQKDAASALGTPGDCEEAGFRLVCEAELARYSSSLNRLGHVHSLLSAPQHDGGTLAELRDAVQASTSSALKTAKLYLHKIQNEVEGIAASDVAADVKVERLRPLLQGTSTLSATLSPPQHKACETDGVYAAIVTKADEAIRQLCDQAQAMYQQASEDDRLLKPSDHATAIKLVSATVWFDGHLLACQRPLYVEQAIKDLHEKYSKLCQLKTGQAKNALNTYMGLGAGTPSEADALRFQEASAMIEQLSTLTELSDDIQAHVDVFMAEAQTLVQRWSAQVKKQKKKLQCSASPKHDELAKSIDQMLGVCDALGGAPRVAHLVEEAGRPLFEQLADLSDSISKLFQATTPGQRKEGCTAVLALQRWRDLGLSRLTARLPSIDELQRQIVQRVGAATDAARAAVESSSGDAEKALAELSELAKDYEGLDCAQTAWGAESALRQVFDLRNTKLDEMLQASLKGGCFSEVREQILPLLESTDPIKRQKLSSVIDAAHAMLHEKASAAKKHVGHATAVAEALKFLSNAGEHLGEQLIKQKAFDAHATASELRKLATLHLTKLVEKLDSTLAEHNYEQIFRQAPEVREYNNLLEAAEESKDTSQRPTKRRADSTREVPDIGRCTKAVLKKVDKCLGDVDDKVAAFAAHLRSMQASQDEHDTADLCRMLGKLQSAASATGITDLAGTLLADKYEGVRKALASELKDTLDRVSQEAEKDPQLLTMAIGMWNFLHRETTRGGLKGHVRLDVRFEDELDRMKKQRTRTDEALKANCMTIESIDKEVQPMLSKLKSSSQNFWLGIWYKKQYSQQRKVFSDQVNKMLETVNGVLQQQNYFLAGQTAAVLEHIFRSSSLTVHLEKEESVVQRWTRLGQETVAKFRSICKQLKEALDTDDLHNFEVLLRRLNEFEDGLSRVYGSELKQEAQAVHQAMYEWVDAHIAALESQLEGFALGEAADSVQVLRRAGEVLVSTFALYLDMAEADKRHSLNEEGLRKLHGKCTKNFGFEAARTLGMHFAILQLKSSATETDVKTAHKTEAMKHHADHHNGSPLKNARMQSINAARDELLDKSKRKSFRELVAGENAPFVSRIKQVPKLMLDFVENKLQLREYEQVSEKLRFLDELPKLLELASVDKSEAKRYREGMQKKVDLHLNEIRVSVEKLWQKRDFKALNEQLTANDRADKAFSSSGMYSPEWSRKIHNDVEEELDRIVAKARQYLAGKSEAEAEAKIDDFAMQLILLGRILDDLPRFMKACRQKMSQLLDLCHDRLWGHCFTFKLGMRLGQGSVGDRDKKSGKVNSVDDRIGKSIVSEFKHFKDVTTMVWNQEVSTKDAAEIAQQAKAWSFSGERRREVKLPTDKLVEGYKQYQKHYDKCFLEWGGASSGRDQLANIVRTAASEAAAVRPASSREWSEQLVSVLPRLVAHVFCYFTIANSGESYKRLKDSKLGGGGSESGSEGATKLDNVLLQPHSAQVLTVLQMLGYGSAGGQLRCQLMQIRTGEGKSIILGACSAVLALLGFRVRCVCYSEYLSERDYALFKSIFQAFHVLDRVTYSTITRYSEDCVERKGNIRDLTEALLRGETLPSAPAAAPASQTAAGLRVDSEEEACNGAAGTSSSTEMQPATPKNRSGRKRDASALASTPPTDGSGRKAARSAAGISASKASPAAASNTSTPHCAREILLVDEVDVFFGEQFYGQLHNQTVELDAPEVSALLRLVWQRYTSSGHQAGYNHLLRDVKQSAEYKAALQRFRGWGLVIEREVKAMCADVLVFNDPEPHYDSARDRLGYKVMDGIDYYGVAYRYRTAFAHLDMVDNGRFGVRFRDPEAALKRTLFLQVPCGKFSYANIEPECILGVSGTLDALGDYEVKVMERYNIKLFASMPSVYGDTQLLFDHPGGAIVIEKSEGDWHRKITDEVNIKIRLGRAVIVFFETTAHLKKYQDSSYFKQVLPGHANLLDEGVKAEMRDFVIGKAATSEQATFASAVFGRGTDFFCRDSKLTEAGGVHVLQTFFSSQKAEEVQIQGRTARQGKKGTYGLVLLRDDLEKDFGLGKSAFDKVAQASWYDTLDTARRAVRAKVCSQIENNLAEANAIDALTNKYFDSVRMGPQGQKRAGTRFLELFQTLRGEEPCRTNDYHVIFLVDVSGSMLEQDKRPQSVDIASSGHNNRVGCAMEACDTFVRMRCQDGAADLVTLTSFSTNPETVLSAAEVHDDMITRLLTKWKPRYGLTNFGGAFSSAASTVRGDVSGMPVLIMFLTDGVDGSNSVQQLETALSELSENENVSLRVIGFGGESHCDMDNLTSIAERFGEHGKCISAIDEVALVGSFEAAAAELSYTGKRKAA